MKKTSLPTNDFIWVADGLPHENPTIEKVKKADFAKKHGFTWSEHYHFDDSVPAEEQALFHAELDEHLLTRYGTTLAEMEDNLMLCPMGEAGYGAFTRKEIKNGPVAIYIGQYYTKKTAVFHRPDQNVQAYTLTTPVPNVNINSHQYRNMASYIQHIFSAEAPDILFNLEPAEHFAISNLVISSITIRGWPVMMLGSACPVIPKMKLIGYNYSLQYFTSIGIEPILFKESGIPFPGKPYQPCKDNLLELRMLGLKLYQLLDALRRTDKSTSVSLEEFSQKLHSYDFDLIKSTAVSCYELSDTIRIQIFPTVWTNSTAFINLLNQQIKNRLDFIFKVQLYTLLYQASEILTRCNPDIIKQLAHPFPKQFNYLDLFRQGFSDNSAANSIVQAIILKNTGKGRIAKPSFQPFFDSSKAFLYYAQLQFPFLKNRLLEEYPKYKVIESSPATVPSTQFHHQPSSIKKTETSTIETSPAVVAASPFHTQSSPAKKTEASAEDYKTMCGHLKTVFSGEWKHQFTKKNIWIEGNQHSLETVKSHLEDHKVTGVSLRSVNKKEDKYCLILSDPKLDQINAVPKLPEKSLDMK